ncbi:hypothetical protein NC653_034053 [Populus alba x Populus x berolinensis]|uniref:NmrA-like domain-containing protein n=1 Tax=Populus alba x Populus x berolinensis TaxID=444605 RepID=A0AAD6LLM3_9ROSI|nr:hypothetical protein NC653_034053 [Populus alba x Populus x berolinensis]
MNGHSPNAWEGRPAGSWFIGSMGFIGGFIAEASLECGPLPSYLLIRPELASLSKRRSTIKSLQDQGSYHRYTGSIKDQDDNGEGDLEKHKIEICDISCWWCKHRQTKFKLVNMPSRQLRFLPSEFGHDIDRADPVEPGLTMYKEKRQVRRYIEEAGIPYTYICCNSIGCLALP